MGMPITSNHRCRSVWCSFIAFAALFPMIAAAAVGLITPSQFVTGDQTLVSAGEEFELGFFSLKPHKWYIGIWYKKIETRTIVWVANRDSPLTDSSGIFGIGSKDGKLILVNGMGDCVWSSNCSSAAAGETVAELLDNGNLVLRRGNDENPIWQSFDYPTDALLPGMRIGWDSKTGINRFLASWNAADDPSTGAYRLKFNLHGFPEIYLTNKDVVIHRSGPWNGLRFSGVPTKMMTDKLVTFRFVMNPDEVSYSYDLNNRSIYSRLIVNHSGSLQQLVWVSSSKTWSLFWSAPKDECDEYRVCGAYGICDINASPVCVCPKGFEPSNPEAWSLQDGAGGCHRKHALDGENDKFLQLKRVKLPEAAAAAVDMRTDLDQCREMCSKNISCRGYSNGNIQGGGSGCVMWSVDLYDMRQFANADGGQDFYLRVASVDFKPAARRVLSENAVQILAHVGFVALFLILLGIITFFLYNKNKPRLAPRDILAHTALNSRGTRDRSRDYAHSRRDDSGESKYSDEMDLPLFDLSTLLEATEKFCDENKLGQGGFGCVYKGRLMDGQEIAVKRLSKASVQGNEEFKNELDMIARLQHRNLVRLLGCCIQMEEKMLIYEYMENKSLDSILFNKDKSSILDWPTRFRIICGVARGLLYLHQDSRFRIIHRDLKASNVLLDKEMIPKISDFGMARIFGGNQMEAETRRVVGTYGYMSPEYAMDGVFSIKSDVFSFGVLVLEIVSGIKNRGFYQNNNQLSLLGYAWKLHAEGRGVELVDPTSGEFSTASQVNRCLQVGLLCVQEHPEDRPTMSTVLLMLSSDSVLIPQPNHPGYCFGRRPGENGTCLYKPEETCTVNQVTLTMLVDGR